MRSRRLAVMTVQLTATEPVSIADPLRVDLTQRIEHALTDDGQTATSLPVAADPGGRPFVRGTSVLGALRAHLAAYQLRHGPRLTFASNDSRGGTRTWHRAATLADLLLGSDPEERGPNGTDPALRPSAVRLVWANLVANPETGERTRTAIARDRGAPAPHKLFRRGHLGRADLDVLLQVDLPVVESVAGALNLPAAAGAGGVAGSAVGDLVVAVHQWQPRLGGGVGVGFGSCAVTEVRWGVADPLPVADLLAAPTTIDLFRSAATSTARPQQLVLSEQPAAEPLWRFDVAFDAVDPLLVAPVEDGRANSATTATAVHGSSWRGLFRSRAEFILRTCGVEVCDSSDVTCGTCPTCELFGWAPAPGPTQSPGPPGAAGLIRFLDSPASGTRLHYTQAPVDRFTGGAADRKLFSRTSWAPGTTLDLTVEQASAARPVPAWARHLLTLVVRDLDDGLIGVGNSTSRGYGTLALRQGHTLPDVPADWLDAVSTAHGARTSGATR